MCDCHLTTEDGYKFFRLDDGRWVDSVDEDQRDMTYDSFDQVVTFVDLSHYHRCDSCTYPTLDHPWHRHYVKDQTRKSVACCFDIHVRSDKAPNTLYQIQVTEDYEYEKFYVTVYDSKGRGIDNFGLENEQQVFEYVRHVQANLS